MTRTKPGRGQGVGKVALQGSQLDGCPPWCLGCWPGDATHRSQMATLGREQTGWISVYLVADHDEPDEPVLRVQVTRHGSMQRVVLTSEQMTRLIRELIQLPDPVPARLGTDPPGGGGTGA